MTTLSLSWREFLNLRFPSHPRIRDPASTQTVPYSANIPPDPEEFLRQSSLDSSLQDRALRPLKTFLEQIGVIDDPVPPTVTMSISMLFEEVASQKLESEYDVLWILQNVRAVVSKVISALECPLSVAQLHPEPGKLNFLTQNLDHPDVIIKAVAADPNHPQVLYRYATELQESQVYEPIGQEGGRAIAVQIWLREYTFTPQADFGLFFSGISAILTERVTYNSGEHALLVSPHYHLFDDDNPPVYDFCTPHDEGGLPLLAVLTSLLLPGIILDAIPQLPALANPLKMRSPGRLSLSSKPKQDKPAPIEEDVVIIDPPPSALLFYVDHVGASAAPRTLFRYGSLSLGNSVGLPPLSLSGSASSSVAPSPAVSSPPSISTNPISWSVTISQEIHRGNYARVWRGTLSDGSCISPLVVKMYPRRHFDVMKKEIKAYQYLHSHQLFDITPAYYGAFAMPDQFWAAIILANGGENECFKDRSWERAGFSPHELKVIWNHCKALHSIGMAHQDLQPRNITRDAKGVIRIIDFEYALYNHSCDLMSCLELSSLGCQFDSFAESWRE
ncbi:uncharacterized protein EV420DRAFT_1036404 [Desarmillaria tabescens]|uniref:Protein kinase domain-containing protein n=1 Tax=Armillaria tabescens TaxID=1929756 RepID=A0AA39TRR6_ARMTA|nr:uncharacterized protein EV420DRAFT_1036404 [Desarmillaria tabescens]KAK0464308.1 hypothetical protein EV420DRAFT_1036404 [Desarmillaria tabescens]